MAQAREGHTGAQDVVSDYDAISRVLQLCTEGEAKGDVEKLREAFHADARMFGSLAVVAEENYWGTVSFIDYFLLARIEGDWKIVCKLFAHTAGEPPEGI